MSGSKHHWIKSFGRFSVQVSRMRWDDVTLWSEINLAWGKRLSLFHLRTRSRHGAYWCYVLRTSASSGSIVFDSGRRWLGPISCTRYLVGGTAYTRRLIGRLSLTTSRTPKPLAKPLPQDTTTC